MQGRPGSGSCPELSNKQVIGTRGSSSEALTNHLALTYFAPRDILRCRLRSAREATAAANEPSIFKRGVQVAFHLTEMSTRPGGWPADPEDLAAGRNFVRDAAAARRVALVPDHDVDGLTSGVLVMRALERLGEADVVPVLPAKGEHVHAEAMKRRILAVEPDALVVVDMGSRAEPILDRLPTLIIDHHRPAGHPPGAVVVNGHAHEPVAPTALLTWHLLEPLANLEDLDWLMATGTVGDLGATAPFEEVRVALRVYGRTHVTRAVALLNAARRAPAHDVHTAFDVLQHAADPAAIVAKTVRGADRLERYRAEVKAELDRCARAAPAFAGRYALIRIASEAQVHPLLAARWSRRLREYVVIAANDGYLPGRVNFAMRNQRGVDMLDLLRRLDLGDVTGEFGFGHPAATGGSLAPQDFARLLEGLGFAAADPG